MTDTTINGLAIENTTPTANDLVGLWNVAAGRYEKIKRTNLLSGYPTIATGTWTPTLLGSTSNPTNTYTVQVGSYVKIGVLVIVSFHVRISNTSGGSGNIRIGGLPFAAKTLSNYFAVGTVEALVDLSAGNTAILIEIASGAQYIDLIQYGDNTGGAYIGLAALSFTSNFVGTICYEAAA